MAKYIKRIRYRRRRVFRSCDFISKASVKVQIKAPIESPIESKEEQHITQGVIDDLLQTQQTDLLASDLEVDDEPLAYFEKGKDPYAYLVSQLPLMLNSIPNLLHEPNSNKQNEASLVAQDESEQQLTTDDNDISKTDRFTPFNSSQFMLNESEQHGLELSKAELDKSELKKIKRDRQEVARADFAKLEQAESTVAITTKAKPRILCQVKPGSEHALLNHTDESPELSLDISLTKQQNWLQWRTQAGTQSNLLLARLMPSVISSVMPRAFPWLGLPGHSGRKIRYGGHYPRVIKDNRHDQQATTRSVEHSFFHLDVLNLANKHKLTLAEFIMSLTSVSSMAELVASAELSAIARVYISLPKQSLNDLATDSFLKEACKVKQLTPKLNWLDCLHPWLILVHKTSVTLDNLAEYLNQAPVNRIYKITLAKLSCYVEIGATQVCLSNGKDKPVVVSKADFIARLSSSFSSSFSSDIKKPAILPNLNVATDELVHLLVFQADDRAKKSLLIGLENKLAQGLKEWQVKADIPFGEFVSSAALQSS
ncbi:hypothetical protein [Colwellia psychrerythraea]|nr:hypothetical protein [Colwellia psychrerythraea]